MALFANDSKYRNEVYLAQCESLNISHYMQSHQL